MCFFILHGNVVALLAICTSQGNLRSQNFHLALGYKTVKPFTNMPLCAAQKKDFPPLRHNIIKTLQRQGFLK
jgi:hypothetical protein